MVSARISSRDVGEMLTARNRSTHLTALKPAGRFQSHCYEMDIDELVFDRRCALTLVALAEKLDWDGDYSIDSGESEALLRAIDTSSKTRDGDGCLTVDEIHAFAVKNKQIIMNLPQPAHGLLQMDTVKEAFERLDINRSGTLEIHEFERFMHQLEAVHLQYLLKVAFLEFRAFYGRGQDWSHPGATRTSKNLMQEDLEIAAGTALIRDNGAVSKRKFGTFQIGRDSDVIGKRCVLPVGWLDDMLYYSANNHPLHGIVACDPNHRLSRSERVLMEVVTIGFTFFVCGAKKACVLELNSEIPCIFDAIPFVGHLFHDMYFFSIWVTLSSMVVWWVLFLLFTTPKCGQADKATDDKTKIERAHRCSKIGNGIGVLLCVLGLCLLGYRIHRSVEEKDAHRMKMMETVIGRVKSYVVSWIMMAFVYFNPVVAWGQPDPAGSFCVGDLVGLGQWRIEKQRFQALCIQAIAKLPSRELATRDLHLSQSAEQNGGSSLGCFGCFRGNRYQPVPLTAPAGGR